MDPVQTLAWRHGLQSSFMPVRMICAYANWGEVEERGCPLFAGPGEGRAAGVQGESAERLSQPVRRRQGVQGEWRTTTRRRPRRSAPLA